MAVQIPYVRDFDPRYGQSVQVSPRIRRVVANNPGPFTFAGTGTYIVGSGTVAVIDPGPADDAHLAALLDAVRGETVSHVLVTHTHADHSPLARPFAQATGAAIWAARPPSSSGETRTELDDDHDQVFAPDTVLEGGERLDGPDWALEAIATPGHASNHMAFALAQENALFSGDHVMGWSTTIVAPPDGDMADYLDSLRAVMARGFDTVWPTHGGPITDVAPFLDAYLAHRLEREAAILEQLAQGERSIAEIVPILYAAVDQHLWPAASLSVLAHLIKLVRDGVVVAEPAPVLTARFRLE